MTDGDRGLILIGIILLLAWRKEDTGVTLKQTCCYEDGTTVQVPLGDPCPDGAEIC